VIEAAAVVRSVTAPLLGAMLPEVAPSDAYERLRSSPLMRLSREGLQLHDTERDAIARQLRASDPERYLALRRACWSRQRAGTVVDREEILADVWGDDADVASNVVDVVVRSLRKKLAERANALRQSPESAIASARTKRQRVSRVISRRRQRTETGRSVFF
jgi:hypothetical protein